MTDRNSFRDIIESFWSTLKLVRKGTIHKLSEKYLQDTVHQIESTVRRMTGKHLSYERLVA